MNHLLVLVMAMVFASNLVDAACRAREAIKPAAVNVYATSPNCVLPCQIEVTADTYNLKVSWFRKINENLVALDNEGYWERKAKNHLCLYGFSYLQNYSRPSSFDCSRQTDSNGNIVYNCDHILDKCYVGDYICRVTSSLGAEISDKTVTVLYPPGLIIEPVRGVCFHPSASNISATLIQNGDLSEISLTWTSSAKPKCRGLRYCKMARRYSVRMAIFRTAVSDAADYTTSWLKTAKRRETKYVFDDSAIVPEMYFTFEVKNERQRHTITYPSSSPVQIKRSGWFYFGQQEKASLIVPPQDEVRMSSDGDFLTITCTGTGLPVPRVTLSYLDSGELLSESTTSPTVTFNLFVHQTEVFYCEASNYFVNESGLIEHVVSGASITILRNISA